MYNNIGEKIQVIAAIFCGLGILGAIISGIVVITMSEGAMIGRGLLIMFLGTLLSWIGSLFLSGFGHLIENSDKLVAYIEKTNGKTAAVSAKADKPAPFAERVKTISTSTLELILKDPKGMYNEEELRMIKQELQSRQNAQ